MKIETPPSRAAIIYRGIRNDVALLGGLALVTYGAWLAWAPAGFIVPGILLLAVGVLGARQ